MIMKIITSRHSGVADIGSRNSETTQWNHSILQNKIYRLTVPRVKNYIRVIANTKIKRKTRKVKCKKWVRRSREFLKILSLRKQEKSRI